MKYTRCIIFSFLFALISIIIKYNYFDTDNIVFALTNFLKVNSIAISSTTNDVNLFTNDKLKEFNGITKKELYISILGIVYDVTRSKKHYGPGQPYHVFTGRDASRSFITGNFDSKDTSDEVSNLSYDELLSVKQWQNFYEKQYERKGKLIGRYYDTYGNPTTYAKEIEKLMAEAVKHKDEKDLDEQLFPACNIEWNPDSGTRVWCSKKSGGIARDWSGFPRRYYKPGIESERCVCIKDHRDSNPNIVIYENCDVDAKSCNVNI